MQVSICEEYIYKKNDRSNAEPMRQSILQRSRYKTVKEA